MNAFEFAFTLFGLVLGLALAGVLNGFVRVLKARSASPSSNIRIRMGVQTPLLGLVVTLDLISFWLGAWEDRQAIPVEFAPLVFGSAIAGIYYVAASLVFPDDPEKWAALDDWFDQHKGQVALGILMANFLFSFAEVLLFGTWSSSWVGKAFQVLYLALAAGLIFSRRRWLNLALLSLMLLVFLTLAARPLVIG